MGRGRRQVREREKEKDELFFLPPSRVCLLSPTFFFLQETQKSFHLLLLLPANLNFKSFSAKEKVGEDQNAKFGHTDFPPTFAGLSCGLNFALSLVSLAFPEYFE